MDAAKSSRDNVIVFPCGCVFCDHIREQSFKREAVVVVAAKPRRRRMTQKEFYSLLKPQDE